MAGFLIGNYIHYRASNYLKYGTTMSQKSARVVDLDKIINDKHESIKILFQAQKEDDFKKQYEKELNYIFGTNESTGSLSVFNEDELLDEEFRQLVQEKFPNIIIDFATLNTSLDGKGGNYGLQPLNIQKRIAKGKPELSFATLENMINQLKILMNKQKIKEQYKQKELEQHRILLQKVDDTYKAMYATAKKNKSASRAFIKMNKKGGLGLDLSKLNKQQRSFFTDLNELISLYNIMYKSNIQGELGEMSAAYVGAKLQGIGVNELRKFIEQTVMDSKTNKGAPGYWHADYSSAFVDLAKFGEEKGWKYHDKNGGYVTATISTQNKVDIEIKTPEGIRKISAKNYNLKQGAQITALKGSSLLTLIQNENKDNFVNHYFNITAKHEEKEDSETEINQVRERMHNLMKQILLINALTGLNISKASLEGEKVNMNSADYFAINDSSKPGAFKIFSMSDILNVATNNFSGFAKFVKLSGYNNPEWNNTWAESGAKERISNILMQAHRLKIHIGISASALKHIDKTRKL